MINTYYIKELLLTYEKEINDMWIRISKIPSKKVSYGNQQEINENIRSIINERNKIVKETTFYEKLKNQFTIEKIIELSKIIGWIRDGSFNINEINKIINDKIGIKQLTLDFYINNQTILPSSSSTPKQLDHHSLTDNQYLDRKQRLSYQVTLPSLIHNQSTHY